ncbi:2p 3p-cyclic-nucleotide 3p-phosphodiesterase [Biomphalaria glabrata]|nr:2-3-cyclic-nucleotide 3'-phosphodiesterase-like [Biomphalaria glabrata]
MSYASLCTSFVTTAPVLFLPDFFLSATHQSRSITRYNNEESLTDCINVLGDGDAPSTVSCFISPFIDNTGYRTIRNIEETGDVLTKRKEIRHVKDSSKRELKLENENAEAFLNFPFFTDRATCMHLKRPSTKVMFIMRGLSGSGKSTIVQKIKSIYAKAVVCSADDYFYSKDGVYNHDHNLLGAAHADCQSKAAQACQQNAPIIVIDNTNVKRWEMKYYADLGNVHGYVIVTVQPKTPWKMDPVQLAQRNKHGVPYDILKKKVQMFDDVVPVYYGWFLCEKKSNSLMSLASKIFLECIIKLPEFKKYLLNAMNIKPKHISDEMAEHLLSTYHTKPVKKSSLLHCTSMYCGSGRAPGCLQYHRSINIQSACGQVFELALSGLIITKRTMAARVTLSSAAAPLFKNAAVEEWNERTSQANLSSRKNEKFRKIKSKKNGKLKKNMPDVPLLMADDNLNTSPFLSFLTRKFPKLTVSGSLRNAHFTLKTSPGVESKEVNTDILDICQVESSSVIGIPEFVPVTGGQACYLGDGICCVYFDVTPKVKTIFSGYY